MKCKIYYIKKITFSRNGRHLILTIFLLHFFAGKSTVSMSNSTQI